MMQRSKYLIDEATKKFYAELKDIMTIQLGEMIKAFEQKNGRKIKIDIEGETPRNKKVKEKMQKEFNKILKKSGTEFEKTFTKSLPEVVNQLESRFMYQISENGNMPLELNTELGQDLKTLLSTVYDEAAKNLYE